MSNALSAGDYLPHQTPMILVDWVIVVDEESVHCQVSTAPGGVLAPFLDAQGSLPAWFGMEIMAQTIGVWSGWHARRAGTQIIRPGMLLGGRNWRATTPSFPGDITLDIKLRLLMRDDRMGSFEGDICHGDRVLATGRLNTYQPNEYELQQLMSQGKQP